MRNKFLSKQTQERKSSFSKLTATILELDVSFIFLTFIWLPFHKILATQKLKKIGTQLFPHKVSHSVFCAPVATFPDGPAVSSLW